MACRDQKTGAGCRTRPVELPRSGQFGVGPDDSIRHRLDGAAETVGCGTGEEVRWLRGLDPGAERSPSPSRPCHPRAWGRRWMDGTWEDADVLGTVVAPAATQDQPAASGAVPAAAVAGVPVDRLAGAESGPGKATRITGPFRLHLGRVDRDQRPDA
jgi:hypothetical protein